MTTVNVLPLEIAATPLMGDSTFLSTPLGKMTKELFFFKEAPDPSSSHLCTRVRAVSKEMLFAITGIAARTVYYALPLELFPRLPALGHTFAVASTISWGGLVYCSLSNFDKSRITLMRLADPHVAQQRFIEVAKIMTVIILGLLASVPIFTVAYLDNGNSLTYFALSLPNAILAILSLYKSANYIQNNLRLTEEEKTLHQEKARTIQHLNRYIATLPETVETETLTSLFDQIASPDKEEHEKAIALRELLLAIRRMEPLQPPSQSAKRIHRTAISIGALFSLCQLAWTGYLSFLGWNTLTRNAPASISLGAAAVLINAYYSQELMKNTVTSIVLPTMYTLCGKPSKLTLTHKYYPVHAIAIKSILILASLLTCAVIARITMDAPYPLDYISTFFYAGLTMLAPMTPLLKTADDGLAYLGRRSTDAKTKKMFELHTKLNEFCHALMHASVRDYRSYKNFLETEEV